MKRFVIALLFLTACGDKQPIVVGSKNFTESVILGEMVAQKLESAGCKVDRRLNMGGTFVCDSAITSGALDAYVEYSGTALEAILKQARPKWERPAVVMDLDETVLDNSAFQTFLYRQRLEYTDELWAEYEANYPQDVTLVPGAKSFVNKASGRGVTVAFIVDNGAPIEFLQFDRPECEIWPDEAKFRIQPEPRRGA